MRSSLIRGATRKIVQLVGQGDRQFPERSVPRTFTDCQLYGTDVGAPLDFGPGRELRILFGDAWTGTFVSGKLTPAVLDKCGTVGDDIALDYPYNTHRPYNADPVGKIDGSVTAESVGPDLALSF